MGSRRRGYDWFKIRDQVLDRDGRQCKNCGAKRNLVVHHVVPITSRGTNDLGNLLTLCRQCHRAAHDQRFGTDRTFSNSSPSRKIFTVDEIATVCGSIAHPLQLAVVVTLAKTGIGVGEVCNLSMNDVDIEEIDSQNFSEFDGPGLRIRYGGDTAFNNRRERTQKTLIPIDSELETVLRRWLLIRPDSLDNALFVETNKRWGRRIKPASVRYIFEKAASEHGLSSQDEQTENLTPVAMRYFFEERFRGEPHHREYILGRRRESNVDFTALEQDYRESVFQLLQ